MANLIQLPNGSWINPTIIKSIRAFGPPHLDPEVSIVLDGHRENLFSITCKTLDEAKALRDAVAALVNAARADDERLSRRAVDAVSPPVDHPILDVIRHAMEITCNRDFWDELDMTRESECLEFQAKERRYEIVVREIDPEPENTDD